MSALPWLLAAFMLLVPVTSGATILFNTDVTNTTGNVANDYHIKMCADTPINVTHTFEHGGDVAFNDAQSSGGVSGSGTNSVTVNWSGATVNPGQDTHVGVSATPAPTNLRIKESWWTFGGVRLVAATSGRLPSCKFDGPAGSGIWVVARVELWRDIVGTEQIGTIWWEGEGTTAHIYNGTCSGPIFASWSFTEPSEEFVSLEDLNPKLSGFGPRSSIVRLDPMPKSACAGDADDHGDNNGDGGHTIDGGGISGTGE